MGVGVVPAVAMSLLFEGEVERITIKTMELSGYCNVSLIY